MLDPNFAIVVFSLSALAILAIVAVANNPAVGSRAVELFSVLSSAIAEVIARFFGRS